MRNLKKAKRCIRQPSKTTDCIGQTGLWHFSLEVKLADVTEHVPRAGQDESQIMQFRRWLNNQKVTAQLYYLPFIGQILRAMSSQQTIVLVIDGTTVGRGCMALMVSVLYQKRPIPLLMDNTEM
jgi:hypothetical protein